MLSCWWTWRASLIDRLMLPNPGGGSRSCELGGFGHECLPPLDIMGGISSNDDLRSIPGSTFRFRDVGSGPSRSNL